jgi:hypothetical protein
MAQMSTVRKIKTHKSIMRSHDSLVYLKVGRGTRKTLNIDTPLLTLKMESLEGSLLAGQLDGINVLVATVVSCTRVTLGVLV